MFSLNKDQEQTNQTGVDRAKIERVNSGLIQKEILDNMKDEKWKRQYDQEYKSQFKRVKGMAAMGKGQFSETRVKEETLSQMKKDAVFQNAINFVELSASKVKEGDEDDPAIHKKFCVPNCCRKHEHTYMYDYSKDWRNPVRERPGECHDQDQAVYMVKGSPINLESDMPILEDFEDSDFKFNYETIDPKASYKFNQTIESYAFPLKKVKKPGNAHDSFNYF